MLRNWPPREQTNTTKTLEAFCANLNTGICAFTENVLKNHAYMRLEAVKDAVSGHMREKGIWK